MGETNRRLKKNIVINRGLQFKIIMTSMVYMFLVMLVTTGAILFPLIFDMLSSSDLNVQYAAAQTFLVLAKRLMPSMVVLFALFFFHQLFITHRICGPLVNFTNTFRRISNGDLTRRVTLRKGDYLKKECDIINGMIEGLSDHFHQISTNHVNLVHSLEASLEGVTDPLTRSNIEKILADLTESITTMAKETCGTKDE
ncbi:MAG: methyl-accepting chemotaxis protein [Proteobacteria bacterium]|nr:methyl-accepting chemotaxis protein [Pseudomonadota bacterium]